MQVKKNDLFQEILLYKQSGLSNRLLKQFMYQKKYNITLMFLSFSKSKFTLMQQNSVTDFSVDCVESVSVRFRSEERESNMAQVKERGGGGEESKETFPSFPFLSPLFHFLALVSLLARSKSKISFLGLSLLRNLTETLLRKANFSVGFRLPCWSSSRWAPA